MREREKSEREKSEREKSVREKSVCERERVREKKEREKKKREREKEKERKRKRERELLNGSFQYLPHPLSSLRGRIFSPLGLLLYHFWHQYKMLNTNILLF